MFGDGGSQRITIEHVEHLNCIGHLHRGSTRIRIACHNGLTQPLRRDDELLAQFTGTEQHDFTYHKRISIDFHTLQAIPTTSEPAHKAQPVRAIVQPAQR